MSQQQNSAQEQLLFIAVPIAMLGIFTGLLYAFVPPFRWGVYLAYAAAKLVMAIFTLDLDAAGRLTGALQSLAHMVPSRTGFDGFAIINRAGAAYWREGIVTTLVLLGGYALILQKSKLQTVKEEDVIREIKNKTLDEVIEEWDLPPGIRKAETPREIAEIFTRIREKRNIPPSVLGRKLKDPKLRQGVIFYNKLLKTGFAMQPVEDPDELMKRYLEHVKKMQKEPGE